MRSTLAISIALVLLVALAAPTARAQQPERPKIVGLRVGFADHYKAGHWTPVELTLQGGTSALVGQVELTLPDGDGTPSLVVSPRPVQVLPGQKSKVLLYAKIGSAYGGLNVTYRVDGRAVIERRFTSDAGPDGLSMPLGMQPNQDLIVTLGPSIGTEDVVAIHQRAGGEAIEVVRIDDVGQLPTEWYGYDGVDTLVLATSQAGLYRTLQESGARSAAIARWVELGGKLVLSAGSQAPTVLARDGPLARLAPGKFAEAATLRRTAELEAYAGGARKVPQPPGRELALPAARLTDIVGVVEVSEAGLPLLVRAPRGLGRITFIGVDLDQQPFLDWEARGALVNRLLGYAPPDENAEQAINAAQTAFAGRFGIYDLMGQMRSELDEFPGVRLIPFAVVALLILGYILLIGPGDYLLVKRVLRRMELTWITFPLWVVLVSAGAYALAIYTKGEDLRINQLDLVDVDTASGLARSTTWLNIFSPRSATFDLALTPRHPAGAEVADSKGLFAWLGSNDSGLAGFDSGSSPGLFSQTYSFAPALDALAGVPIQVWSTKGFIGRTTFQTDPWVTAELVFGPDNVPEGTLTSGLDQPLRQCLLVSGRWAYLLGDLEPGQTLAVKAGQQRDLEHVLKDVRIVRDQKQGAFSPQTSPYRVDDNDLMQVLQQLMFYGAAGRSYTGLANGYLRFIDMSPQLDLERAILVGQAQRPAAQLTDRGQPLAGARDQHWTVYRFVLPVKRPVSPRK